VRKSWGLVALFTWIAGCGGGSQELPPAPAPTEDATLGSGDVFDVRVYGEQDLSGSYRVTRDGTIDFPFIGRTHVAGLEPTEVAEAIRSELRDGGYLQNPQVSIFVREYNSKRVSVVGAVENAGTFPVSSGMTVVHAISLAGGFTALASRNDTVVTRRVGGRLRRFRVRVEDAVEGTANDFPLQPGDIIYVPERIF
jgi:protein involved in polysaccharide export with SLBB domain